MTRKWLNQEHDRAEEFLLDGWLSGEKHLGRDITYFLDGEPVDDLILAIAKKNYDEARDILKGHVMRFLNSGDGYDACEAQTRIWEIERESAHIDHLIDQQRESFA